MMPAASLLAQDAAGVLFMTNICGEAIAIPRCPVLTLWPDRHGIAAFPKELSITDCNCINSKAYSSSSPSFPSLPCPSSISPSFYLFVLYWRWEWGRATWDLGKCSTPQPTLWKAQAPFCDWLSAKSRDPVAWQFRRAFPSCTISPETLGDLSRPIPCLHFKTHHLESWSSRYVRPT